MMRVSAMCRQVVIKYADNILKTLARTLSLSLSISISPSLYLYLSLSQFLSFWRLHSETEIL